MTRRSHRALRRRYGRAKGIPWQGTDYIERRFNLARNALVDLYLFGVKSMGATDYRSISTVEKADEYLARARETLAWLESQKPAPYAKTRRWMTYKVDDLRRLLQQAEAVRAGGAPKMG